jgi:hypothetical protein
MSEQSYTVVDFCAAERICCSMLYRLWTRGKGPGFYYVGAVRRITEEARREWHQRLEAAGAPETTRGRKSESA